MIQTVAQRGSPVSDAFNALLQAQTEKDPAFAEAYERELKRIQTYDRIVNAIEEHRENLGLTKKRMAQVSGIPYSSVRRLLTSSGREVNPTVGTLADLAASVNLRLTLEPDTDRLETKP